MWSQDGWLGRISECRPLDFAGGTVVHMVRFGGFGQTLVKRWRGRRFVRGALALGIGARVQDADSVLMGRHVDHAPQSSWAADAPTCVPVPTLNRLACYAPTVPPRAQVGGVFGLVGAVFVGPRLGRFEEDGAVRDMPGQDMGWVTLGTLSLWFGW